MQRGIARTRFVQVVFQDDFTMEVRIKVGLFDFTSLVFFVDALILLDVSHESACFGKDSIASMTNKSLLTLMILKEKSSQLGALIDYRRIYSLTEYAFSNHHGS